MPCPRTDSIAQAARRAPEAGIGKLELHFADGYLGASFFAPLANNRADGGSLETECASITKPWTPSATRAVSARHALGPR